MSILPLSVYPNLCSSEDGIHLHWHKTLTFCSFKDQRENIDGKVIKRRGMWDMHLCRQHGRWCLTGSWYLHITAVQAAKAFPWLLLRPSLLAGKYCFNNLPGVNVSVNMKDKITMIQFPGGNDLILVNTSFIPQFSKVSCMALNSDF